ncbi:MAG: ABC transporter ATP-binding protein [Burkholderiales bacterium]
MRLELAAIHCGYDSVRVLKGVSLQVQRAEVHALLGRNGAGKTTTLKAIMGLVRCREGSIRLDGEDITQRPSHLIPRMGVAYVPQGRRLFPQMTVDENLRMGLLAGSGGPETKQQVLDLFPLLRERLDQKAVTMSGGQQQMLAMGRALCLQPKVLLLDEPCEGLQPSLVDKLLATVAQLRDRGVSILLVEQKVDAALQVADRISFLENGEVRHQALPAQLRADPEPLHRYVGVRR